MLIALAVGLACSPSLRADLSERLSLGIDQIAYQLKLVCYFTEPEFQKKVLDGVGELKSAQEKQGEDLVTIKTQTDQLTDNYDQLDQDTKKAFEDLTKVKNECNSISDINQKLRKVQLQLGRERSMAFGDPVKALVGNEELRARINAAVRMAASNGADMHSVAKSIMSKALGEDSAPGSNYINAELAAEIYDTLASYGVWNTFSVRRMSTKQSKLIVNTARPEAYVILQEGGTIPDDANKAGTTVTQEAEIIAVLLNVSMQLLEDSESDIAEEAMRDFMEAFAFRLDYLTLRANGTADATNGGMTGAFEFGTAAVAAAGNTTMETLDLEDVTNCMLSVDPAVLARPCRWWLNPQILVRMLHIKDGNGRPIFLTATEAPTAGGIGSILGYPTTLAHAAPNANGAGSKVATFGDPGALSVGVRTDYKFESSDHHKWSELQRSYRGHGRAAVKGRRAQGLAVLTTAAS